MREFWIAITPGLTTTDLIDHLGGAPVNETIADHVQNSGGASRLEYDGSALYETNLVFQSSNTGTSFIASINGNDVTANILGGPHSPQRPK